MFKLNDPNKLILNFDVQLKGQLSIKKFNIENGQTELNITFQAWYTDTPNNKITIKTREEGITKILEFEPNR